MQRIQPPAVRVPSSTPFASSASSFPSFSFANLNLGRALTGRNLLILAAVGTVILIAYKILHRNSSSESNSNKISSPKSQPKNPTQIPRELSKDILHNLFNAAREPQGNWLTLANTAINSLKELDQRGSITEDSTRELHIDPSLLQKADFFDMAFVLQHLNSTQAPIFLSGRVAYAYEERLTAAFFKMLLEDKTVEQAKQSLLNDEFLALTSQEPNRGVTFNRLNQHEFQFKYDTLKTLFTVFQSVEQTMARVKSLASTPIQQLLKDFILSFVNNKKDARVYHLALILSTTKIKDPMLDFVAPLQTVVWDLYLSEQAKYWSVLDILNGVPYYIHGHWCIAAIQDLLPMKLWNKEYPQHLALGQNTNNRTTPYVSQLKDVDSLLQNPNVKLSSEDDAYICMTLALAVGTSDSNNQEQLKMRLKNFLIEKDLSKLNDRFAYLSIQLLELTDVYHKQMRSAYKILAELSEQIKNTQ